MQRDPLVTRNDKATAERLDSVEKQIATIGEDSSAVMGIVTVPVFPDVDLRQWISWMEHYFARKGLTDFEKLHMAYGFIVDEAERYISGIDSLRPIRSWKHMKETLLWQFGADDDPEKIRMKASYDRGHKAFLEWEADKRRRSRLCSGDSGDITFTDESTSHNAIVHETGVVRNCSLSDLIQPALDSETVHERDMVIQTVPAAEVSVQSDTILEKDVFAETGHEDELSTEKEAEQVSKSLCIAAQEEKLVAEMSLDGPDMVKLMALATVDGVSVSSSDWHVSRSEAAQEAEVELKPASLQEMEHQAGVKLEISANSCVEQFDSSLETVSNFSLVEEKLTDRMNSSKKSVHETGLVSNDCLVPDCSSPAIMLQRASRSESQKEAVVLVTDDTLIPLEQNMDSLQEQLVQQIYSPPPVFKESDSVKFLGGTVIIDAENVENACVCRLCGQRLRRVPSKKRERKCLKTRKFKYKLLNLMRIMLQMDSNQVIDEKDQKKLLTVTMRQDSKYVIQLLLGVLKYHVKHKWRVKHFKPVSDSEGCVDQLADENDATEFVLGRRMLAQKNVKVLRKQDTSWLYERFWKYDARSLIQFLLGDVNFHLKHKWRFKWFRPVSVLACVLEHAVAEKISAVSDVKKRIMSMRDHNRFSLFLEHRGVEWRWVCSDLTMSVADTRPEWQRSLIIFFCVSLRASLISRARVYKRILKWLWRLKVLIVWFSTVTGYYIFEISVGKHKETTAPSTLWWIQVVNLQLHKERRAVLLMSIRRYRLQVWVQQKLKWKRNYKTWMFKYKERMKQVHALL
ncbi:unnamed protein product, partial [Brassica rapa subsp. trilocularis]